MAATTTNHRVTDRPVEVKLSREDLASPRFTPRELRIAKEQTGRSFAQLVADDSSDEKWTVLAWMKLRRDGFDIAFEDMDDVVIDTREVLASMDPTIALPPTISPGSADTGE